MHHPTPDDRDALALARAFDRQLRLALTGQPGDEPPAELLASVMSRLAPPAPSAWFERGLWAGGAAALAAATAWAASVQPGVAASLEAALRPLLASPAAPALGWLALGLGAQALLQGWRRGGVR